MLFSVSQEKEIYFHVGLGKVASTFLQTQVFPHLNGVQYIPPNQYRKAKQLIQISTAAKFLISREFDRQLETELSQFCKDFSNVRVILFLRRHGEWMASQYKRHVKNGWHLGFDAFYDMKNDQGFWKKYDLKYTDKIKSIKLITSNDPLVITYDELLHAPIRVLDKLASFSQTSIETTKIKFIKVHTSFSDRQLLFLESFTKKYIRYFPPQPMNRLENWLKFRPWWALFHVVLYFAYLLPKNKASLIDNQLLIEIDHQFSEDWDYVVRVANQEVHLI